MARELKGYAAKRARGLVPYRYEGKLRGVAPPVRRDEAERYEREAFIRAARAHPFDRPVVVV